jgi:excisionase family DNA binding protein
MASLSRLLELGGWPALLSAELACRYLSLESAAFLKLADRWGIMPVDVEDGARLWRRSDLDKLVRRLPTVDIRSDTPGQRTVRLHPNDLDRLAKAVVALLEARVPAQIGPGADLLSIPSVARQLGIGRTTVYRMIGEGRLDVRKIGRRTMITTASVNRVIEP